jgi:hypothetical protein
VLGRDRPADGPITLGRTIPFDFIFIDKVKEQLNLFSCGESGGYRAEIRTRNLDVHIRRLRKKLGNCSDQYIETIFGIGYRVQSFREPPSQRDLCGVPVIVSSAGLTSTVGLSV